MLRALFAAAAPVAPCAQSLLSRSLHVTVKGELTGFSIAKVRCGMAW